jgi:MFS family permease
MQTSVVPAHRLRRVALYAGGFLGPFGGGMVTVLVPELRDAFGVPTASVSLALTAYLVPFAALQLVSGTLGERVGRARATRAAFAVYAVASLAAAATGAFAVFLAARAVQGAANAFTTPLVLAALADDTPETQLGQAMGTFAAVQTAGVVGAPLVGGLAGALDYRLAFLAAAAAALALVLVTVPERRAMATATPVRLADALTPRTRWTAAAAFLAYFAITGLGVVVALRAGDAFGLGPSARGLLLAGFGVAGVVAGRPAGDAADRVGAVRVALAGSLPCCALLPLLGVAPGVASLAAIWLAAGGCSALLWAGMNVLTVGAAPRNRGGAVSIIGAFKFAGNAVAPLVWLALYDVDPRLAFALAGAASLSVAATVVRAGAVTGGRGASTPASRPPR